ncbi:MAG: phenylalanine--tRNA ligase subunit beta [Gammaproteobacteria bacterium]
MKINEEWLREWVDPPLDHEQIAAALTLAGLEVDDVAAATPALDAVVVVEVRAATRHPDAERLAVCTVATAGGEHVVVCGAPNVRAGMRCAWAPPGTTLPGGQQIGHTEIRGIASAGMLCSAAELGLGDDAGGLLELDAAATIGATLAEQLRGDDVVFELGLTPNRGDCFSVLGIARDLAVITALPFSEPAPPVIAPVHDVLLPVELAAPEACARYAGRVVRGIDARAVTPVWMRERLRRAGVRAIHPVVDITNYVMLELGQPMHAFDLARLNTCIRVRQATAGETLLLLDGAEITLDAGTLVIADGGAPVALAGVMGGELSSVTGDTVDIFLESAYFDPVRLAGVARHYRMQTDASTRFERGVDPTGQERAIERATALLLAICGGEPGPTTVVESLPHVPERTPIRFRPEAVNRLLGTDIPAARAAGVLRALGMHVDDHDPALWLVEPPAYRFDIALEADLIEEVARIEGYDTIPSRLPGGGAAPATPPAHARLAQQARDALLGRGYFEAITYSFVAPDKAAMFEPVAPSERAVLANPISSEMAVMRPSLWPGLVDAAGHNLRRQQDDVALFEQGLVFTDAHGRFTQSQRIGGLRLGTAQPAHWSGAARAVDFYDVKGDVEVLLEACGLGAASLRPGEHPALHPGQTAAIVAGEQPIGWLGKLHPALARRLDLPPTTFLFELALPREPAAAAPQYRPISRFPAVRRDLNIVVDAHITAQACLDAAREGGGTLLRDLQLIDVYRGQGIDSDKKSLTLCLIFQVASSTLTDDEIEHAVTHVLATLRERVGGTLRN